MTVEFLRAASDELDEAVWHYDQSRPGLGDRFLAAVRRAIDRTRQRPLWGESISQSARRIRVHGFPYALIYNVDEHRILIAAVMHLHREPNYWSDRLE